MSKVLETSDEEWTRIVELLPGRNIYLTREYSQLFEKYFCKRARLFVFGDDNNFVVHPIWEREIDLPYARLSSTFRDALSPWYHAGPTMKLDDQRVQSTLAREFLSAFHDYCKKERIVSEFVRFYPVIENHKAFSGLLDMRKAGDVVILDLNGAPDAILRTFSKECRKNIRKASRSGVEVFFSRRNEDIGVFHEIYSESMRRKGAKTFYNFSYQFLVDLLGLLEGAAMMFFAAIGETIVVGDIVLYKYGIAEDYLRGFDSSYSQMRPNNMLVYVIAQWCKEQGNKLLNLGGGLAPGDELFRFKSGFSKATREYFVSGVVHDSETYQLLCKQMKAHGNTAKNTEYFPAYRSYLQD